MDLLRCFSVMILTWSGPQLDIDFTRLPVDVDITTYNVLACFDLSSVLPLSCLTAGQCHCSHGCCQLEKKGYVLPVILDYCIALLIHFRD